MPNEDILKRALIEAFSRDYSDIPNDEEIDKIHTFSNEFEIKMKKLQKKSKIKYVYIFNLQVRRMAVIAVCIIVIFTASMSIEAVRTPIIKFCVTIYEKFSSILFINDSDNELSFPTTLETLYAPDYVPDGYILDEDINDSNMRILIYTNENGNEIEFNQYIITTTNLTINTEGITTEDIFIYMNKGIFYTNKEINVILWHDEQYGYLVKSNIEKSLLQRMAESIKVEK